MTLRSRRIIYLIFIVIFVIIAPVIILYTAGYRYNFQKHKLQKTGILILKSKPAGANIYLNDELQKNKTPARIANLLPDDYSIRVEMENYHPWQKTLTVQSRLTTFAENIHLFKKNLPASLLQNDIDLFLLSPDKGKLLYLQNQEEGREIWLLDLTTMQKKLLYRLSASKNQSIGLEWSYDSQKILINIFDQEMKKHTYTVINDQGQSATSYQKLDDFYLEFRGVGNKELIDFQELEDNLLLPGPSRFITLVDTQNHDLTIRDGGAGYLLFKTKAQNAAWSQNGDRILYATDFETSIFDPAENEDTLITRYGKEIKRVRWINDNYIALLIDNDLKIIEIDERDQKNVVDLAALDKIVDFDVDTVRQKIYLVGELGNKKGVYELQY